MMKTRITMLSVVAIAGIFAFNVQSDEPEKTDNSSPVAQTPLGQELEETLALAFTPRLTEYEAGRCGPEHLIRLNQKLYEAQIAFADSQSRSRSPVAQEYHKRAKQIETIAQSKLASGTGTSQELLEAKAARISAAIEFAKY